MAYSYGVNATKIADPKAANIIDPGGVKGVVRSFTDEYTGTAAEAGDELTVLMGPELPVGARVLWVAIDCPATGITIHVGDADDTNRYIDAAAASTVTTSTDVLGGLGYEIDGDDDQQIILTLSASCNAVKVKLVVMYTTD